MVSGRSAGLGAAHQLIRIVNLSFKISGVKEQAKEIQELTAWVSHALMLIRIARVSAALLAGEINPLYGVLHIASMGLSEVAFAQMQFTDVEEVNARGK